MAVKQIQVTISADGPMWNIQCDTPQAFGRIVRDLDNMFPQAGILEKLGELKPFNDQREELTQEKAEALSRAAAAVAERTPTPIAAAPSAQVPADSPKCPEHGKAATSKFYTGLYCPAKKGEGRCDWKWEAAAS